MRKRAKRNRYAIPLNLNSNGRTISGSFVRTRKIQPLFRNPKTRVKIRYYKNSDRSRSPATFKVVQPRGVGTGSYATIMLDPVLKNKQHKDLKRAITRHEKVEIDAWETGSPLPHTYAKSKEGRLTERMNNAHQFWSEIDRRNGKR
jgi:hypothetical protein